MVFLEYVDFWPKILLILSLNNKEISKLNWRWRSVDLETKLQQFFFEITWPLVCTKKTHDSLAQSSLLFTVFAKKNFICRILGREAKALVFADSSTYSGRDDNPLFDEDDELALMARHKNTAD